MFHVLLQLEYFSSLCYTRGSSRHLHDSCSVQNPNHHTAPNPIRHVHPPNPSSCHLITNAPIPRRIILVDSTRRGKHLPDALSKTVPIWCAVMNRLLSPSPEYSEYHRIERVKELVPASEHAQMEARLEGWVASAQVSRF